MDIKIVLNSDQTEVVYTALKGVVKTSDTIFYRENALEVLLQITKLSNQTEVVKSAPEEKIEFKFLDYGCNTPEYWHLTKEQYDCVKAIYCTKRMKIPAIKQFRTYTNCGLKCAKTIVENPDYFFQPTMEN